jgi:hypothetical protein
MIFGATGAPAQMEPAVGQRGFDLVTGIVFYCGSATGFKWTIEACEKITADFKKRAAAAKMPFVEVDITADFSTKKLPTVDGFDQDKAVRALWYFVEDAQHKGMIKGELSSRRVWEPTAKEIPNVVPGQRIAVPFWIQSATFNRGATYRSAKEYLDLITEGFFMIGEQRRK